MTDAATIQHRSRTEGRKAFGLAMGSARPRCCDAAAWWLRRTDNVAIGWGDIHLAHEIADLMGWEHDGPRTPRRVLNALDRTPGELVKTYVRYERLVRNFYLPEKCPAHLKPNAGDVARGGGQHSTQSKT